MSDKHETIAAIIAEMRDYSDRRAADAGGERPGIELLRSYADRIEGAVARERENTIYAGRDGEMTLDECITRCDNNSGDNPRGRDVAQIGGWLRELRERRRAPGNAAAMRDLLEKIRHEYEWGRIGCRTCVSSGEDVVRVSGLFEKQIDSALASPARNCDRQECADVESAWATYCAEMNMADCKGFARWLFAPAEGGRE